MARSVPFSSKRQRDAAQKLASFIETCRYKLTVFGADLNWEENQWRNPGVSFGNLDQTSRVLKAGNVLRAPFLSFAKAYFRYMQGVAERKAFTEMRALRVLERALVNQTGGASIADVDGRILDAAAVLARDVYSAGVAYQAGRELAKLATFLSDEELVPRCLQWVNPIARPADSVRTGRQAREERERKLPEAAAIEAMAELFASHPSEPRDIFTTSLAAMLLCSPSRVAEVLALESACEVRETCEDGSTSYGWRFWPGKGAPPYVKWIPSVMVPLAEEAIGRVRHITHDARWLASWLECKPDQFPRHAQCPKVAEDDALHLDQIGAALGLQDVNPNYIRGEINRRGFSLRHGRITLRMLNEWVHSQLPTNFPWYDKDRKLRFADALFSCLSNLLDTERRVIPVVLKKPTSNIFNDDVGSRENSASIFERHGALIDKKSKKLTSHQFRHLLNTMAQRGGMSQADIAVWSGRTDIKQNRDYDHLSEFEVVEMIKRHDPSLNKGAATDSGVRDLANKLPMTQEEFDLLLVPTAHVTEYGYCVHDFVMAPCQRFRDCLNCSEQICVKGDRRVARMKERLVQVNALVERASLEIANGTAGADRWFETHQMTQHRLAQLIEVMESAQVPDGTLIRLKTDQEFSPVRRALRMRSTALPPVDGQAGVLSNG
ncbi:integrase [Xanthomonas sp. 3307]|uniref:integrase n=1 Tax=Xanthomonas sp. 3307 TaxID=3035316 RepID=UPI0016104B65|nr:integrase [Xanthomonas sp. 3307]MBB5940798.1 hypothetical protein [Xanthomonas sp. 3307]